MQLQDLYMIVAFRTGVVNHATSGLVCDCRFSYRGVGVC